MICVIVKEKYIRIFCEYRRHRECMNSENLREKTV